MQTVSGAFSTAAGAAVNVPNFGVLISWLKNYTSSAKFFTIGTSAIGGPDSIPSGAGVPTYFDKYDYVPESTNVNSFTVQRTISQIPIGIMSAQADLELDNTSKRYMPDFDATIGAYIKPGRPVKINAGFSQEVVQQFIGYTDRPTITLGKRTFKVHITDAMDYLNNFQSSLAMQVNQSADTIIGLLLAEAGFSSSQYVLEKSLQPVIGFVAPNGQKTGKLINDLASAEQGIAFFDEQGVFRFWNRLHFDLNATVVDTLTYSNMSDVQFIDTPVINDVQVTSKPRAVQANQIVWRLSQAIQLNPGQTYTLFGNFSDDDGDMPVVTLDTPLFVDSQITSYFNTNIAADGTGDPGKGNVTTANFTNFGTSFKIDFINGSTSTVMYVTDLQLYGTPAKVTGVIQQEYQNAASIADNGINPNNSGELLPYENDYIQDASTALAYAFNLVTNFGQPRRQFQAKPFPNPARQFGDVTNVVIADTSQTYKCVNLGSSISMGGGSLFAQALTLEARVFRNYFTIGTSSIGGLDAIAP